MHWAGQTPQGRAGPWQNQPSDEYEEVDDEYQGAKFHWYSIKITPKAQSLSLYPGPEDNRYFAGQVKISNYLDEAIG